jgi:lipoate-protein ligase A
MTTECLVFPHGRADGPENMALDDAILDLVAAGDDRAYLRTYGWTVPTLSLGYFQKINDVRAQGRWSEVALVRRLTGGGAILHDLELTYALVVPVAHPLARPNTTLYVAVHQAIVETLKTLGANTSRRGNLGIQSLDRRNRPLLCFNDADPEDIVLNGFKIVGSAQRRRSQAILQHGSVLLRHSQFTPELAGLCDLAPIDVREDDLSDRLLRRIPEALGLIPFLEVIPENIRNRAAELVHTVYGNTDWMDQR